MKTLLCTCLATLFLFQSSALAPIAPENSATSAILIDVDSGRVLYEKNAYEPRLIASITKLMTALVVVQSTENLSEIATVTSEAAGVEGSSIYLKLGEELSVETLLYGLLLNSGNDAAVALAVHCAGDVDTFVDWMNQWAEQLGMENSHFSNPNGLNDDAHYSTAADMGKLAVVCMKNELISKIVGTKSITFGERSFTNHNKLLWKYEGCVGMKTGYTQMAGRTLISSAQRNGQTLIVVTLNDPNDWADHAALLNYGFENYPKFIMCHQEKTIRRIATTGSLVRWVEVEMVEELSYPLSLTENVTATISLPDVVVAPVTKGDIAGSITYYLDDSEICKAYLVYGEDVPTDIYVSKSMFQGMLDFFRRGREEPFLATFGVAHFSG